MPMIPIRLLKPEDAPADAVDLDRLGRDWRTALEPGITVRGHVLDTDEGIRAAMWAGVKAAAVRYRLPALLSCLDAAEIEAGVKAPWEAVSAVPYARIPELSLLRLLELKGRATPDLLADSLALPASVVAASYMQLCERGLCARTNDSLRLTHAGKAHMTLLLTEERAQTDAAAVVALYEEFCVFNAELKQIMTAWQVRGDGAPNDHLDASYDAVVLQRLSDLHGCAEPLLGRLAGLAPRLAAYPLRLARARARIGAGDVGYVARILIDSYHTVWFELHKELISLAGLNHEAEARAGHAT
jgi:pyruvate,orthophosphate dikinase